MLKKLLRRLFWSLLLLLLLLGGGLYGLYQYGLKAPLAEHTAGYQYTVPNGATLNQVALELARREVLSYPSAAAWVLYARASHRAHLLKAGDYEIPPQATAWHLLEMLLRGKTLTYSLTLLEGWNFSQVLAAINQHPKLKHSLQGLSPEQVMEKLDLAGVHPEGRFCPDTYHFSGQTGDVEFLQRAYRLQQQALDSAWAERAAAIPIDSPEQALVLASIIEKETGVAAERPLIAGVFVQRLRRGMRLQTDPTVIYGLGAAFDGNLRAADLRNDTPYNTYTRAGLPPTPIAMPSRAALHAAVNPDETGKYLYFVAKGDGSHQFSKTLQEHQCAVVRYQLKDKTSERYLSQCRTLPGCSACRN